MFQPIEEDEEAFDFVNWLEHQASEGAKRGSSEPPTSHQKRARIFSSNSRSSSSQEDYKPDDKLNHSQHRLIFPGELNHQRYGSLANYQVKLREAVDPSHHQGAAVSAFPVCSDHTYGHLSSPSNVSQKRQSIPSMNLVGTSNKDSLMLQQQQQHGRQARQVPTPGDSMPSSAMQSSFTGSENLFTSRTSLSSFRDDSSVRNAVASGRSTSDHAPQHLQSQRNLPLDNPTLNTGYESYLWSLPGQGTSAHRQPSPQMLNSEDAQHENISQATARFLQANLVQLQFNEIQQRRQRLLSESATSSSLLAPCISIFEPHSSQNEPTTLGIDEDHNWLSEFQCFIRSDLIEVIQADQENALIRSHSKTVKASQVGIRCLYCAHLHPGQRVTRSSAFPSSIKQLYQSFTMMQRDHFASCDAIPSNKIQRYLRLQHQQKQGACDSKQYWIYSARRIGMVDTEDGIVMTEQSRADARNLPSFGSSEDGEDPADTVPRETFVPVIMPNEASETTAFIYKVLSQLQVVYLLPSERVGKRKNLPVRLKGLGCRHCCQLGRLGFSRSFPLRRRALPSKIADMYHSHLVRCTLCPSDVKSLLARFSQTHECDNRRFRPEQQKAFYDKLWKRLGRNGDIITT